MNIAESFRKAKEVREQYAAYSLKRDFPISLDDLIKVVSDYAEVPINIKEVGFQSSNIYARLSRYKDRAEIEFSSKLNNCYRRYAVTKELSQLIIDTHDSFAKDYADLVAGLVDESFQKINEDPQKSEHIAHYVACELLLPFELRDMMIQQLKSEQITFYKIALAHRMPEAIVEKILYEPVHEVMRGVMDEAR